MNLQNYGFRHSGLWLVISLGLIAPTLPVEAQSMGQAIGLPRVSTDTGPSSTTTGPSVQFQTVAETPSLDATYRLNTGDVIAVEVFGAEEYGTEATIVLQDGTINLPRVGQVLVRGLTLRETEAAIVVPYGVFLRQPIVSVTPVNLRPVRIAISGEVKRPGSYIVQQATDSRDNTFADSRFPTLTEVISQAGGITARADISEVVLRRPVGYGQVQTNRFNLWDLLKSGDLGEDLVVQGGDEIFVPTATALTPDEAMALGSANFAPDTISIYVAGEVESPGQVQVPLNTPLNEVLLNAGGFDRRRANTNTVDLVRLSPDGRAVQQQITVDFTADLNSASNPILQDRDVIVVDRSGLTTFGDTTGTILSPFTQILNSIFGVRRIFD